ncbi:MAG: 3'-5' exonuclease domain-containing protein 2 [Paludibacteraceae bacterium]|nr:3'-5' exonuclease domain-containing protein 2 [Paludibacteraceae bacterium]
MNTYPPTITKEEINEMPQLSYANRRIEIVTTAEQLAAAIQVLEQEQWVGFDTETKPSFVKGVKNKVALLQLSTPQVCYLIRVNKLGIPSILSTFLAAAKPLKIGLSLHDDYRVLLRSCKFKPLGFVDLQKIIKKVGIEELGLQKMYAILFGKKISKAQRLTNWEAATLTPAQQEYAAIDAWACVDIYEKIKDEL